MAAQRRLVERVARTTHIVSAFWVIVLALIILVDVTGRYLFSLPLLRGGMIKTTLIYDLLGPNGQRSIRTLANVLGLLFFLGTALSAWGPAIEALGVSEYEGEGALRVPTYPVRFLVAITSAFAAYVSLYLMYLDWTGRLLPEAEEAASA
jgi:TRAP-type C4-dicarboxylate transport system permease small subunit